MNKSKGFTLLELLIAISIFSLISVLTYNGLQSVIHSKNHVEKLSGSYRQLERTFLMIEQDMAQVVNRAVRDAYGDRTAALITSDPLSDFYFEFTRSGVFNLANPDSRMLQRVAYYIDEKRLMRRTWPVLDRLQSTTFQDVMLTNGIEDIQLSFFTDDWKQNTQYTQIETELPRAIKLGMDVTNVGTIERIFPVIN